MRALAYHRFGDPEVLSFIERDPPAPRSLDVVVRVRATALNPKDVLERKGRFPKPLLGPLPRVPGYDLAGDIAAMGPGARRLLGRGDGPLRIGDAVFGMVGWMRGGACAQYAVLRATELAAKPRGLSYEQAAALPLCGLTALQALRDDGGIREPRASTVVIHGASGGVGTLAIQVAKALGAHVISVSSERNMALCVSLGADEARAYDAPPPGGLFSGLADINVFFDCFGNQPPDAVRGLLGPRGRHVSVLPRPRTFARDLLTRLPVGRHPGQQERLVIVRSRREDLEQLAAWVHEGALRPVIDQVRPWDEAAQAHAALETRRSRGKIVLTVA